MDTRDDTTDTRTAMEPAPREAWQGRLCVRCPHDDGSAAHLALDVRLPLSLGVLFEPGACHCGATLGVLRGVTP